MFVLLGIFNYYFYFFAGRILFCLYFHFVTPFQCYSIAFRQKKHPYNQDTFSPYQDANIADFSTMLIFGQLKGRYNFFVISPLFRLPALTVLLIHYIILLRLLAFYRLSNFFNTGISFSAIRRMHTACTTHITAVWPILVRNSGPNGLPYKNEIQYVFIT